MDLPEIVPVIEDVWRCEQCGHETSNKSYLAVHMAYTHQDFKLFKSVHSDHNNQIEEGTKVDKVKAKSANAKVRCKKCPYTTTTVADVKLHIKSVHKKGVNFKCWYCDFTSLTKVELTEHMNKHGYNTLANASVEPIYEKGDSKLDGRDVEVLEKSPSDSYPTGTNFPNSQGSSVSGPESYDTGSSTPTPLNLAKEPTPATQTREIVEERIGNFKCDQCSYTTTILSILARHKKYGHTQKVRNFPCSHCEHKATNENALKAHVSAVHNKVRKYRCDDCGHATARRANLMSHITEVHAKIRKYR